MLSEEHQCTVCRIHKYMGKSPVWPEWSCGSSHPMRALDSSGLWDGTFLQSCLRLQLIVLPPWLPNFLFWTFCLLYSLAFSLFSYLWTCPFNLIILPEKHYCFFDLALLSTSFLREVHASSTWVAGGSCLRLLACTTAAPQQSEMWKTTDSQSNGSLCPKYGPFG